MESDKQIVLLYEIHKWEYLVLYSLLIRYATCQALYSPTQFLGPAENGT